MKDKIIVTYKMLYRGEYHEYTDILKNENELMLKIENCKDMDTPIIVLGVWRI